ncbi:MAG: hypothetical protein V3V28_07485 [Polaribacter sp.]|uniref:hypothetical protein n=1 Tax=Polaribacter sp. TaxID=1920175 RepID=UPI002F360E90
MTVAQSLQQFYTENNFKNDGGKSDDFFELKFKLITLKLPNSQFRKDVIHVHDIQHILYNCDTSWKGEAFIAGWEIGSKMWKHFPIGFMSLWAAGFSLLNYPKEVLKGYKEGIKCKGIIDLPHTEEALLKLSLNEIKELIKKEETLSFSWWKFLFWSVISSSVFLFPLLLLIAITFYFL